MKRIIRVSLWIVATLCIIGLAYQLGMRVLVKRAETNPNYLLSQNAVTEFVRLLDENKLPGITVDQLEGTIKESGFSLNKESVHYPAERTIQLHKKGEPGTGYFYTLSLTDPQSQWALVRAWKESGGTKVMLMKQ